MYWHLYDSTWVSQILQYVFEAVELYAGVSGIYFILFLPQPAKPV